MLKTIDARWKGIYFIIQTTNPTPIYSIFNKFRGKIYENRDEIRWLFKHQAYVKIEGQIPFMTLQEQANILGIGNISKIGENSAILYIPEYKNVEILQLTIKNINKEIIMNVEDHYEVNTEKFSDSVLIEDDSKELKSLFNDISVCEGIKNIFHNHKK